MSKPWEGRGAIHNLLLKVTPEGLDELIEQGFDLDKEYDALATGDGSLIAHVSLCFIAHPYT